MISMRALIPLFLLAVPAQATECFNPSVELIETERYAELVNEIPVPNRQKQHTVVYEIRERLLAGDIVGITARFEVTNMGWYNIMVGSYIAVAPGGHVHPAYPATGNVTPDMHHWTRVERATFQAPVDGVYTFRLMVYAAASRAEPGDWMRVEYGYGGMTLELKRCEWIQG